MHARLLHPLLPPVKSHVTRHASHITRQAGGTMPHTPTLLPLPLPLPLTLALLLLLSSAPSCTGTLTTLELSQLRNSTVQLFQHAFGSYMTHAFPKDELQPLSCRGIDSFGGVSVTLIDSLDTLAVMGLRREFAQAVEVGAVGGAVCCCCCVLSRDTCSSPACPPPFPRVLQAVRSIDITPNANIRCVCVCVLLVLCISLHSPAPLRVTPSACNCNTCTPRATVTLAQRVRGQHSADGRSAVRPRACQRREQEPDAGVQQLRHAPHLYGA